MHCGLQLSLCKSGAIFESIHWVLCTSHCNAFWVIDNHLAVCCCNKLIQYSALMLHDVSNWQRNVLSEVIVAATNGLNSASVYQPGKWLAIKITDPFFNGGRKTLSGKWREIKMKMTFSSSSPANQWPATSLKPFSPLHTLHQSATCN